MTVALIAMLLIDGWLVVRRQRYTHEIARLRGNMTDVERRKTDMVLASEQNRLRVMLELGRRQAQGDQELHLAVAIDSGAMVLGREGAVLRRMPVEIGAERWARLESDSVRIAAPRGERTVERVLGEGEAWEIPRWVYDQRGLPPPNDRRVPLGSGTIVLNGGTLIYARPPNGPLADSAYVLPGSIRARSDDLRAIAPNVAAGMTVYLY